MREGTGASMARRAVLAALVLSLAPAGAGARDYEVTDLQNPRVDALNDVGQVLGRCLVPHPEPCIWENGTWRPLEPSPAPDSDSVFATDLNDRGEVVGTAPDGFGGSQVVLWSGNHVETMGTFSPIAINDAGEILGHTLGAPQERYALLLTPAPVALPLPIWLLAINDFGEVPGTFEGPDGTLHLGVWTARGERDLGALAVPSFAPQAIDNRGRIVGYTTINNVVLWSEGQVQTLPLRSAVRLTDPGDILGEDSQGEAVVYRAGQLTYLRDFLPPETTTVKVVDGNDCGQVLLEARLDGTTHGFVMSPVEPGPDRDGDGTADGCDPEDAALRVTGVVMRPTGIRVMGVLEPAAGMPSVAAGVTVRVEGDNGAAARSAWRPWECRVGRRRGLVCRGAGRDELNITSSRSEGQGRRVVVSLPLTRGAVRLTPPFRVSLTTDPGADVSGIDHVGTLAARGCRSRRGGRVVRCRARASR